MQINSAISNIRKNLKPLYESVHLSREFFTIAGKEYIQINGVLDGVSLAVIYQSQEEGKYSDAFINTAVAQLNKAFHLKEGSHEKLH